MTVIGGGPWAREHADSQLTGSQRRLPPPRRNDNCAGRAHERTSRLPFPSDQGATGQRPTRTKSRCACARRGARADNWGHAQRNETHLAHHWSLSADELARRHSCLQLPTLRRCDGSDRRRVFAASLRCSRQSPWSWPSRAPPKRLDHSMRRRRCKRKSHRKGAAHDSRHIARRAVMRNKSGARLMELHPW